MYGSSHKNPDRPALEQGEQNLLLFGLTAGQAASSRGWYDPRWHYDHEPETRAALKLISSDHFSRNEPGASERLCEALLTRADSFMHMADLAAYMQARERVSSAYAGREEWSRKALWSIAASGKSSSDRTVTECAPDIWRIARCRVDLGNEQSQ